MDWFTPTNFGILVTLITAAIAWGSERRAREDLDKRHSTLANETRDHLGKLSDRAARADEKVNALEKEDARTQAQLQFMQQHVNDLRATKASVESVESLREALGRIDAKLDAVLGEVSKHHGHT